MTTKGKLRLFLTAVAMVVFIWDFTQTGTIRSLGLVCLAASHALFERNQHE